MKKLKSLEKLNAATVPKAEPKPASKIDPDGNNREATVEKLDLKIAKSGGKFTSLEGHVHDQTMKALSEMKSIVTMTEIQAKSIPRLLEG